MENKSQSTQDNVTKIVVEKPKVSILQKIRNSRVTKWLGGAALVGTAAFLGAKFGCASEIAGSHIEVLIPEDEHTGEVTEGVYTENE